MTDYTRPGSSALVYRFITKGLAALFLFLAFLYVVVMVYLTGRISSFPWHIVLIVMALPLAWIMLTSWLEYMNLGFTFDNKSLKIREGVFSLHDQIIPFYKISNATFNQSFFQRIFNVGNIHIDQEDSETTIASLDRSSAEQILAAVAEHSNIQTVQSNT